MPALTDLELIESMQAQVIRAALHARRGERHAERVAQRGDVLEVDLFLQVLRAGGDQHALAAENGGNQVGERLAGAGARFREQDAAVFESSARRPRPSRPGRRAARSRDRSRPARRRARTRRRPRPFRPAFRVQRELPAQRFDFRPDRRRARGRRPASASAREISSPMMSISGSRIPRVVTAGVPTRMPLATIGGF